MRTFWLRGGRGIQLALGMSLALTAFPRPSPALDKPTGAPLELSSIETEQSIPLTYLDPDGKTAHCTMVRLHWNPNPSVGQGDDAASFSLDLPAENPGSAVFTAQLWSASLAGALAWQQPWQGARWKVFQTPATDGTGIDAALAVGMIATSARRSYPDKVAVMGSLNPDGSLGPVSHMTERLNAAAAAGITRVIIPNVQRFDTDATGQVINMVRHASDLHLECVPVDNLVEATETVMNDPLPDRAPGSAAPRYGDDVVSYIDNFAHQEEILTDSNLRSAPKESELTNYAPRLAAIWKGVYADVSAGQQAYRAGQVYVAYRLFSRANATMIGINALIGQNRATFDVKAALSESDDLSNHLHAIMNPPVIDKGELQSAVLVAEMADWAFEIDASLESAQLVTKQTFSQRTDATAVEKDRAREAILFANEKDKYLLNQADFYTGLLAHVGKNNPIPVDENAAALLPQLIPAQLATARIFIDGIRDRAAELRDGLLFDPRLTAYVNELRDLNAEWDARQHKKAVEAQTAQTTPTPAPADGATPAVVQTPPTVVAFDPGNTYAPPHTILAPSAQAKKISDAARCLMWVNNECEIATLDERYLRLSGVVNPSTHEWQVKDRAKLDALLQSAETGAREGIAFAEKAEVDSSVLSMIYEQAAYLRIQNDDASALEALRDYWRCALLGNICWQLAHSHKAQPVDLVGPVQSDTKKSAKDGDKKDGEKSVAKDDEKNPDGKPVAKADENKSDAGARQSSKDETKKDGEKSVARDEGSKNASKANAEATPDAATPANTVAAVEPAAGHDAGKPVSTAANAEPANLPPATTKPAPPIATAVDDGDANIPVAPIAKAEDFVGNHDGPATNTAPVIGPVPPAGKVDNADGHGGGAFP